MVGYRLANTMTENGSVARGVCETSADGQLVQIQERLQIRWESGDVVCEGLSEGTDDRLSPEATVSMNFWGFPARMMDALGARFPAFLNQALPDDPLKREFFLPSVIESLIDDEGVTVRVLRSPDRWFGVTYKEDRQSVVDALQSMKDKGLYPEKLWK